MKVKILKSCSGYHFSFKQGETVDVDEYIGNDLIHCGFAEKAATAVKKPAVKKNADA